MCTPRQCTTRWQVGVGVGVGVVAPSRAGRTVSPSLWTAVVRLVPRVVEVNGRTFCAYVRFLVHLGHLGYHHRRRACAHLRHGSTWCHPTAVPRGSCGGRPLGSLPPATNQEHDRPQRQQLQSGPSTGAEQGVRSTGGESTALSSRSRNGGGIGVEERVERRSALAAGKNKDTTAKARRKKKKSPTECIPLHTRICDTPPSQSSPHASDTPPYGRWPRPNTNACRSTPNERLWAPTGPNGACPLRGGATWSVAMVDWHPTAHSPTPARRARTHDPCLPAS